MRIGIDMRMAGTGEGIGRYAEELVKHLMKIDFENQYFLICSASRPPSFQITANNFFTIFVSSNYYSLAEQTWFIYELLRLHLDLIHFPNFNVPLFYPKKFIVTIHDMIHHQYPGKKKSRFHYRWAYRFVFWGSLKRAKQIISVSNFTKNQLSQYFKIPESKLNMIHEGTSRELVSSADEVSQDSIKNKYNITKPFILFVGVWRRYKNLPRLARAYDLLRDKYGLDVHLALAGKSDPHYPEIKSQILESKYSADIKILGYVPDSDLLALYQAGDVFVLPSLFEGFGLIGIEAQANGLPIAASDIPVLREILGEGAIFFNPDSTEDMSEKIYTLFADAINRGQVIKSGLINVERFSWLKAAEQTLAVYKQYYKK